MASCPQGLTAFPPVVQPLKVEEVLVKRLALIFGIVALVLIPAGTLAQDDYPSGPSTGGGGGYPGGGSGGGGISVGGYPSGGGHAGPAMGSDTVDIVDFAFQPTRISVPAGTRVTWRNTGNATHTVTAFNGAFDSGRLSPGSSYSVTFSTPGAHLYHCQIHENMVGIVQVTPS